MSADDRNQNEEYLCQLERDMSTERANSADRRSVKRSIRALGLTSRRTGVLAFLFLFLWWFSGYRPTSSISIDGDVIATHEGKLVTAARGFNLGFVEHQLVPPIRLIDLHEETVSALPVEVPATMKVGDSDCYTSVIAVSLSSDGRYVAVIWRSLSGWGTPVQIHLTVVDLLDGANVFERQIATRFGDFGDPRNPRVPVVQFSPDSRLLAIEIDNDEDHSVVLWNLVSSDEQARLPNSVRPVFSPDGTHLATLAYQQPAKNWSEVQPPRLQCSTMDELSETRSLELDGIGVESDEPLPQFSPDGTHIALGVVSRVNGRTIDTVQVVDIERMSLCLSKRGWSPLWLADGTLVRMQASKVETKSSELFKALEIVMLRDILQPTNEKSVRYDFGANIISGTVLPRPQLGRGGEYLAVHYDTTYDMSSKSAKAWFVHIANLLHINASRGLGLDLVDGNANVETYHLEQSNRHSTYVALADADVILVTNDRPATQKSTQYMAWSIPPRGSYRLLIFGVGLLVMFSVLRVTWIRVNRTKQASRSAHDSAQQESDRAPS